MTENKDTKTIGKTSVEIKEISTREDLKLFADYPNKLYKDVDQHVPAFLGDDIEDWIPEKNPAFEYCEGKCFLAYRNGEIVGRIGAILSHKANEKWGTKRMRFSQVDFIDDKEVSEALFNAVENWAREKGCDQVHGPLGFCDMDKEGMLVEGFEHRSMMITYYNHPYYNDHLASLGYVKDTDWVENRFRIPDADSDTCKLLSKLSQRALRNGKYRKLDIKSNKDLTPEMVHKVFELLNIAYAPLYGVVEVNENQIKRIGAKFIPFVDPRLISLVVDDEDNLVAFGLCLPSMSEALKKCRGRMFPTGWLRLLWALKHNDTLDLYLIAVVPELQSKGLNAVVMDHILQGAISMGLKWVETGPTLETNSKVQSQWKLFERQQHKRRRCYIKNI